ncbi:exodeoxyribonuclease VII small subunit [Sellimonas intestinalis]|uniref:exodeoxyribonuclease VII small subunit n=1 Tax=Sellimonas intestinalis TaxID=1653434 RepID=UPI00399102A6
MKSWMISRKRCSQRKISLEDSFRYYAEAMELLKQCDEQIGAVEEKVRILDENGEKHEFE